MVSRIFLTLIGLACASASALVFLPLAVIFDPLVQHATSHVPADHWFEILANILTEDDADEALATLFHLMWTIGMLVCVVPVTITALIGGVSRAVSLTFHAGLTGLISAAVPWILRTGSPAAISPRDTLISQSEAHLTLILFLTGIVAGSVYWLIAARSSQATDKNGWLSAQPKA